MTRSSTNVVVVGAGLSGLVCARDLQRAGFDVVVLEARDRVGGRTWSQPLDGDDVIELGGQWAGPTQDRVLALAAEVGIDTFATYGDRDGEGETRYFVSGYDEAAAIHVGDLFDELESMAAEIPLEAPWSAEHAREWDAQTFFTWMSNRAENPASLPMLRLVITSLFTAEPDELSLLHVLVYIRSAGSMNLLTRASGGAQERRFVGGSQRISERLADDLGPGAVRLSAPVRRIRQGAGEICVETDPASPAGEFTAERVVVTVPIPLADRIIYAPPLPGYRSQMHQRMSPGATVKVHCVYPTPFWRELGSNGRVLSDQHTVSVTFDNTPLSVSRGVLVAFVEGDGARRFCRLPADQRRSEVIDSLVAFFGPAARDPLEYVEASWSDEEWTRGCFGANFPPGGWTRYGPALREPFGLVHWAGAETSPVWMNYMEGAVRSGERVAHEVAALLRMKHS